jgi:hypothetical protein
MVPTGLDGERQLLRTGLRQGAGRYPQKRLVSGRGVFGFHGLSSERKVSIHKVPLETYMSKICVDFLAAPSAGFLIQPATMWKTHTPTLLVDAGIVLSKRALPDEYRQLNPSSRSHLYPFSPMISVASFSPH